MDQDQAKTLGEFLRSKRESLELSTRQLARLSGVPDSTIVRFEQGAYASPSADKLARLAGALGLNLADVYSLAQYAAPADLPSVGPYLRTKYRDLSPAALDALSQEVSEVLAKHGIQPGERPRPGEDEVPEAPARPVRSQRTRKATNESRKGGET